MYVGEAEKELSVWGQNGGQGSGKVVRREVWKARPSYRSFEGLASGPKVVGD